LVRLCSMRDKCLKLDSENLKERQIPELCVNWKITLSDTLYS
jgi:hypothetical protein